MLGKKLYKTSTLNLFRFIIFLIVLFFLNDFVLDTYTYEKFQADGRFRIIDVIQYHYRYPIEAVTFFFLVIIPAFYYGLVRGNRFYERGMIYNQGLPFFNQTILFSDIKTYRLLHPKHLLMIYTTKGIYLLTDNTIERVIAILDQHNIQGDLAKDDYSQLLMRLKKFIMLLLSFTVLVFLMKKVGLFAH
jgi:hypothetical protein